MMNCSVYAVILTRKQLQTKLQKAGVVYASAIGASEPCNMTYMVYECEVRE